MVDYASSGSGVCYDYGLTTEAFPRDRGGCAMWQIRSRPSTISKRQRHMPRSFPDRPFAVHPNALWYRRHCIVAHALFLGVDGNATAARGCSTTNGRHRRVACVQFPLRILEHLAAGARFSRMRGVESRARRFACFECVNQGCMCFARTRLSFLGQLTDDALTCSTYWSSKAACARHIRHSHHPGVVGVVWGPRQKVRIGRYSVRLSHLARPGCDPGLAISKYKVLWTGRGVSVSPTPGPPSSNTPHLVLLSQGRDCDAKMGKGYNARIAANPYIVGSFACIGGGLFGLDISSMSGVLNNNAYKNTFGNPGSNAQGAIVASMPAGSLVGALIVSSLADKIGRKKVIILSGWIWVIGSILQCASVNRGMLVAGRVISGISVGLASASVPLYQSEITAPSIRGRLVSLQQWSITWGILLQYFVQFGCSYIEGVASFRIPWGLQMIPAIILSLGMLIFPESPRWLMDHDREEEALEILADLHGAGDPNAEIVQLEFAEIREQVRFERTEGAKSYLDLLKPGIFRRVGLGTSLQMWSQLSGMNIMMYYIIYVFQGAGLTGRRGNLIADSVQYVLNVVFTIPAIIYIDKWGRRPMLLCGTFLMGFWLMLVGGLQGGFGQWGDVDGSRVWVIDNHDSVTKGVIVCSYFFVCSFAITMGPVSWTYPAEIFPMRVRAKAVSVSTATNWLFNFALAWAVPPGLSSIAYKTYFIFGTFNFAAFIHILFCFPETAGRTLEEIEDVFAQGHMFTAWRVDRNVGKKTLQDVVEKKHVESHDDHYSETEK